jgi:WD40 repeat protein
LAFSPNGDTLAAVFTDDMIELWNVASGENTATVERGHVCVRSVAFTPDGKLMALGDDDDNTVKMWQVACPGN